MKDPGSITIPYQFENIFVDKCLYDLGSSVDLMPISFFKKLKFANLVPTQVILQLANRSVHYPMGFVEDMLVKVDKFYFLTCFNALDMDEDILLPIIFGRWFLARGRANIDYLEGKLTLRVAKKKVEI